MHVPGGAPRAASRALRCRGGPQKPLPTRPVAPRPVPPSLPPRQRTPPSQLQEARGASSPGATSIFQRQGPRLLPERESAEGPRGLQTRRGAPRPGSGAFRRWAAVRLPVRAWALPPRPGSRLPMFWPSRGDERKVLGKTRQRRPPRCGQEPRGGRGARRRGRRAPRAPWPPW